MIKIVRAHKGQAEVLAELSRKTYIESHAHFIEDKRDLAHYVDAAFSVSKALEELQDGKNLIFITYVNDEPVGYAKLILDDHYEKLTSDRVARLERIYILSDFLHLKIGQQLLTYVENKAKELERDTMWLTVYVKNARAIRFYERNNYKEVGGYNFVVNTTEYANFVYSKQI